jgi:hypothetical protein
MLASSTIFMLPFRLVRLAMHTFGSLAFAKSDNSHLSEEELNSLHSLAHGGGNSNRPVTNDVIWISDSPIADLAGCLLLLLSHNFRAEDTATGTSSWKANTNTAIIDIDTTQDETGEEPPKSRIFSNEFLSTLASLQDNRWEGRNSSMVVSVMEQHGNSNHPPPPPAAAPDTIGVGSPSQSFLQRQQSGGHLDTTTTTTTLSVNFETLFEAFGDTVHTELGALLLYTLLQTSPTFAASVSARSDLDTLVIPLLRTLYASLSLPPIYDTATGAGIGRGGGSSSSKSSSRNHRNKVLANTRTFRSQSQLYVILILLLLFSQDSSFGMDAFRRVTMPLIPWYRERNLKDISLGSVLVLVLLRSITYNLNRLQDAFLLTNCCAVLLNLGPHMKNLHSYAAMRLASVTLTCMKKFASLVQEGNLTMEEQQDLTTVPGMYGEASRSLLQIVAQCLQSRVLAKNLHLLYALVYLQSDLEAAMETKLFSEEEVGDIPAMVAQAHAIIREDGNALTAVQAMASLEQNLRRLMRVSRSASGGGFNTSSSDPQQQLRRESFQSNNNVNVNANADDSIHSLVTSDYINEEFAFTYEEELDPEAFFIPYIWDVTICACTASLIEWDKPKVLVFPLNINNARQPSSSRTGTGTTRTFDDGTTFSKDVADVV